MITIPLQDIKAKIKEQSSLSEQEVNNKIQAKLDQLSGLISEEGAAHIIANELGIKLVQSQQPGEKLQVKNILAGMKNVEVAGKVTRKYELREFSTEKRSGKLASFIISDESGFIRVVLWNDQTDKFDNIKEGDTIKIEGGYVRDNNGRKEIHISETAKLSINPEGVTVQNVQESVKRKKLSELAEGDDNIEVLATIVQVFDIRFFEVDPDTGRRVQQREGKFYSGDKEIAAPGYAYVMNLFLDDGSENVRTVLWRNQIQKLLDLSNEDVLKFRENPAEFEPIKTDLLGSIVKVVGRVNKNASFDRLELIANLIYKDVNPEEEMKKLQTETSAPSTEAQAKTTTEQPIASAEEPQPETTEQPTPVQEEPSKPVKQTSIT
ncbi:OB-fold nucleic acid binding domain-containing protein, partial [Bacteroidota bacterium]